MTGILRKEVTTNAQHYLLCKICILSDDLGSWFLILKKIAINFSNRGGTVTVFLCFLQTVALSHGLFMPLLMLGPLRGVSRTDSKHCESKSMAEPTARQIL